MELAQAQSDIHDLNSEMHVRDSKIEDQVRLVPV